ncbi:MAG: hypothetical protein IPH44_11420 [Myxococcales bacterium]|nr:hypothetical protein [Myxococcales bacterium]MBK7197036.1 hypothetical protein [Myxococcales bacterium]MBP6847197.1 hypothetical protein [Kofleriaceae bacterium]
MIAPRRLAALLVALAACGGSEAKPAGSDDGMVAAWKAAKLDVSALTTVDAKPYGATACRGGTVSGVDVVLCSYGSGEDAQAAQDLGLAAVGDATGAALARGARLLVVVDRRKADPTGRTIDAITAAFRK